MCSSAAAQAALQALYVIDQQIEDRPGMTDTAWSSPRAACCTVGQVGMGVSLLSQQIRVIQQPSFSAELASSIFFLSPEPIASRTCRHSSSSSRRSAVVSTSGITSCSVFFSTSRASRYSGEFSRSLSAFHQVLVDPLHLA